MLDGVDALLRAAPGPKASGVRLTRRQLLAMLVTAGFLFGAAMGSFGERPLQSFYSGLKVPLLLMVATAFCLPSFYVVNTLLGLRDDFSEALRGILTAQVTLSVALAGMAPFSLLVYASSSDYRLAVVFNGFLFLTASAAGQVTLARYYRPLVRRNRRHRAGRACWLCLYVFVAIQLAWMLRPFVGAPGLPTRFFRQEPWDNAYVVVATTTWELVRGKR